MKIVGLIAEYNPFHNGHKYHIEKAKELTGADAAVVVMSGDFVQRGAPALMPKHLRTRCALLSGASMVIELPVCYATASAEYFAMGAVSLLDKLGIVDSICFGSECGDIEILEEIAHILVEEPEEYQTALKKALKSGLSFPLARQKALEQYSEILSQPNNILGIEYLKALIKLQSHMKAHTIRRMGADYHDTSIEGCVCSATAIRNNIESFPKLQEQIPENAYALMQEFYGTRYPIESNNFSLLLKAKLLTETSDSLGRYADVSEELANRVMRRCNDFLNLEQFCNLLKTKELTYSRISRALFHILLGITQNDMNVYQKEGYNFYARVLGFREEYTSLLTDIKKKSQLPLITRPSQSSSFTGRGKNMFRTDLYASDLYESVVTERYQSNFINEMQQQIVKI